VLESLAAAGNSRAAFYLGVALQKTGDLDRAIAVFTQILPDAGGDKALVAFNLANLYFAKDENVFAEAYYSQTIEADRNYAPAYLNRANVRVRTGALEKALEDYAAYLRLVPDSPQRAAIDALVAMVKADLAAEAAERAAAEKAAREEAEARRRVLEQVFSSIAFP
jgi:tetratricopeptide (TPR) repeat protein